MKNMHDKRKTDAIIKVMNTSPINFSQLQVQEPKTPMGKAEVYDNMNVPFEDT